MKSLIIPILPETLEMLTEINGGVTPKIEEEATFYVYKGPDAPAEIVSHFDRKDPNIILVYMFFKQ